MAKEFKDWDKRFTKAELDAERAAWGEVHMLDSWGIDIKQWTHAQVRIAVYEAEDAEKWQRFRVMLKGHSTREKLGLLLEYWSENVRALRNQSDDKQRIVEQCRVDNYIGALRRGGQLNGCYMVVK